MQSIKVGVGPVSFEDLIHVARDGAPVELTDDALGAIDRARAVVETLAAAELSPPPHPARLGLAWEDRIPPPCSMSATFQPSTRF